MPSVPITNAYEELLELFSSSTYHGWKHNNLTDQRVALLPIDVLNPRGTDFTVTLVQDRGLLAGKGVTGAVTWDSSIALVRLLSSDIAPEEARPAGKSIVELGAGCGLVGMACFGLGASSVICTDRGDMLRHLERNTLANTHLSQPAVSSTKEPTTRRKGKKPAGKGGDASIGGPTVEPIILVAELEWGTPLPPKDPLTLQLLHPDLIIASDCIYNEDVTPLLVRTLSDLASPATTILIAQELRSDTVHLAFLESLLEKFDLARLYPAPDTVIPGISPHVCVVIYQAKLRPDE